MIFNQRNIFINSYKIILLCTLLSFLYSDFGCIDPDAENCLENCYQCNSGGTDDCSDDGSCKYSPELNFISDVSFPEDTSVSITLSASDQDFDPISYTLNGGSENTVNGSINGFTATFIPAPNYYGTEIFEVVASDGEFIDSQEFTVTVQNVNDNPIINVDVGLQAILNSEFQYTIQVDDSIDNDNSFIFSLSDNPFGVSLESYSELAIVSYIPTIDDQFIPCQNNSGNECFTFTINVQDGDGGQDEEIFYVEIVESENILPAVSLSNALSDYNADNNDSIAYEIDEDSNIQIDFTVNDDEDFNLNDLNFLSLYSRNSYNRTINQSSSIEGEYPNYSVSFDILDDWNGEFVVTIIAKDIVSHSAYSFKINVIPVNDLPYFTNVTAISFNEGSSSETIREIYFNDKDSDTNLNENPYNFITLDYNLTTEAENIQYSKLSGGDGNPYVELRFFTNDDDYYGQESFTISIVDEDGSEGAERTFYVTVYNVNDAPILNAINDITVQEDDDFELEVNAFDIDNDINDLSYIVSLNKDNAYAYFSENILTIDLDENYYGNIEIEVKVSDGEYEDNDNFTLIVNSVNDLPITKEQIISIDEDQYDNEIILYGLDDLCTNDISSNSEGSIVCDCSNLSQGACDFEDDSLIFSILQGPSNGTYTFDDDATISYSPNLNYNGVDSMVYTVCDQENSCTDGLVTINILPTNDNPIADNGSSMVNEDDYVIITLSGSDIDANDTLDYTVKEYPNYGTIDTYNDQSNMVRYSPDSNYFGNDSFKFNVSDSNGGVGEGTT